MEFWQFRAALQRNSLHPAIAEFASLCREAIAIPIFPSIPSLGRGTSVPDPDLDGIYKILLDRYGE